MRKILLGLSVVTLMIITSCSKDESFLNDEGKIKTESNARTGDDINDDISLIQSKKYTYEGQEYFLTYTLNQEDRVVVNKHTPDNDFLYNLLTTNENLSFLGINDESDLLIFNSDNEKNEYIKNVYLNNLEISFSDKISNKKNDNQSNTGMQSRTAKPLLFEAYEHPNYGGAVFPWNFPSSITFNSSNYFRNWLNPKPLSSGGVGYYAFEVPWVGNFWNDKMSSCHLRKLSPNINNGSYEYDWALFTIFQHANYGGYNISRIAAEQNLPIHLQNMTLDRMWSFMWWGTSWNDEASSFVCLGY